MANLYDELKKLTIMENAYDDWADYRDNLTKIIVSDTVPRTNVVIIGVGDCNDINLKVLADHFDLVCLADRNILDVKSLCDKYNIDTVKRNNIFSQTIDLVGISDDAYRKTADEITGFMKKGSKLPEISDLADYVIKKYTDMYTDEQRKVLSVRPGITDYASIEYVNENELLSKADDPERMYIEKVMPDKIKLNMKYLEHYTVGEYFKIIFLTFKSLVK